MIEKNFERVYNKFKLLLYTRLLKDFDDKAEDTLSVLEVICMEIIVALEAPTVAEFARYAKLSAPNAAYRVNKLIHKGYIEKIQSTRDKREYHLVPTGKYQEKYGSALHYIETLSMRIEERFNDEEARKLDQMIRLIGDELMPETETLGQIKAD